MVYSTPGLPAFTISWSLVRLTSVESVMPSNCFILCPPSPPVFGLSQHEGLFQWVGCSHQVAKLLELRLQHLSMSFQSWFPLGLAGLISLHFRGLCETYRSQMIKARVIPGCLQWQQSRWQSRCVHGPCHRKISHTNKNFIRKTLNSGFNQEAGNTKLAKEICVPLVFIHRKLTFCSHVWAKGTFQVVQW